MLRCHMVILLITNQIFLAKIVTFSVANNSNLHKKNIRIFRFVPITKLNANYVNKNFEKKEQININAKKLTKNYKKRLKKLMIFNNS